MPGTVGCLQSEMCSSINCIGLCGIGLLSTMASIVLKEEETFQGLVDVMANAYDNIEIEGFRGPLVRGSSSVLQVNNAREPFCRSYV